MVSAEDVDKYNEHAIDVLAVACGAASSRALEVIAEIGIADYLAGGPRTVADLAAKTETVPDVLRLFLRLLATHGLVESVDDDSFALTEAGAPLRSDHPRSVRPVIRMYGIVRQVTDSMDYTLSTGQIAFEHIHGVSGFEYMRQHPDHGAVFNDAMAALSRLESSAIERDYDFSGFRRIVDVGGGSGTMLATVLATLPQATGVVFDQPHVVSAVAKVAEEHKVGGRLEAVGGDFFVGVPTGGDLYLLKSIVHDWPDQEAVSILANCRQAIAENGRLVLFERMLQPRPGENHFLTENFNLLLRVLSGSRERSRADFEQLFTAAGFRLSRITPTAHGLFAVEAVPA